MEKVPAGEWFNYWRVIALIDRAEWRLNRLVLLGLLEDKYVGGSFPLRYRTKEQTVTIPAGGRDNAKEAG